MGPRSPLLRLRVPTCRLADGSPGEALIGAIELDVRGHKKVPLVARSESRD